MQNDARLNETTLVELVWERRGIQKVLRNRKSCSALLLHVGLVSQCGGVRLYPNLALINLSNYTLLYTTAQNRPGKWHGNVCGSQRVHAVLHF